MSSASGPIVTGIIGFGRSGYGIHAKAITDLKGKFTVGAIYDPLPERRHHEAFPEAKGYGSIEELLADPAVELVVVASPNKYHARHAIAALKAGKHVLCEKPFGFTTGDVDAMIAAAEKSGKVLQPFQQRRYEKTFRKVLEICRSGILGRIDFVRIAWHGFGRRWDWQTSREHGGGQLYNNMPHPLDYAMEIFGESTPEVIAELRHALSSGDAEDEVLITLRGKDAPTIQVEILSTAAYPQNRWFVCGTAGGLTGTADSLEWKWVDWSKMPERPLDMKPTEGRTYNSEKLEWQTDSWKDSGYADAGAGAAPANQPTLDLYNSLYGILREGKPQEITPQAIRRRVAVMEECYRQCGVPFPEGTIL